MINIIKNKLKKNPKIYKILQVLKFLYNTKWIKSYKFNKHPQVLQFPITNNCNSKCVMCNVTSNISKKEMTVDEFKKIINDDIFKEIKLVVLMEESLFYVKFNTFYRDISKKMKN